MSEISQEVFQDPSHDKFIFLFFSFFFPFSFLKFIGEAFWEPDWAVADLGAWGAQPLPYFV